MTIPAISQTHTISQQDALTIAQLQFRDKDVDYFILEENNQNSWTIFVDAEPMKGWEHDCYLLSIPKETETDMYFVIPQKLQLRKPPSGNYVPLCVKNRYGDCSQQIPHVKKSQQISNENTVSQRTFAIILSGGISKYSNYERYWNDCSFIYQTLVNKFCIPKDNVYALMSDGTDPTEDMFSTSGVFKSQPLDLDFDGNADIKYAATKDNIRSILSSLSDKIKKDDHLFLYVIDHGGTTDSKMNSYICLWNNDILYDYELANLLEPFTEKYVNVNVVLGQCFSGGFNDDLEKIGCVVSSASKGNESSWSCPDIPYDEFVYQWTSAINEASHTGLHVFSDTDNNGRVTMEEAFNYAKSNDRRSKEHPQYISTPSSIGEDLAFNHLPSSIDLYMKDNIEDTGKEPNTTTDIFGSSPSIWVRNKADEIEQHENPIYTPEHTVAFVYVKIYNRGKEKFSGGKWLHVYWAKASTGFSNAAWKGRELYKNKFITGEHLRAKPIPEINPGDSAIVRINWLLPDDIYEEEEKNSEDHHFCILAKIMDTHIDDGYIEGEIYFDVQKYKNQVQKNVSIIYKEDLAKLKSVYVRNISNSSKKYTLELVPRTSLDKELYSKARVELKLAPEIYQAWERGGLQSEDVIQSSDTNPYTVRLTSPESKLKDINLSGKEFDKVSLNFSFSQPAYLTDETYTYDLIQRDENGKIIGGETFIVEPPAAQYQTAGITATKTNDGKFYLTTNETEYNSIEWKNSTGEVIGKTRTIAVTPTTNNNEFTVITISKEGELASDSISLKSEFGIKSISPISSAENFINIELRNEAGMNSKFIVASAINGMIMFTKDIPIGTTMSKLEISSLPSGVYIINYNVNNETVDYRKFTK